MAWPTVCRAAPLVLILDHKLAKTTGSRRVALYAERSKLKLHLRTKAAERRFEKKHVGRRIRPHREPPPPEPS
jgi:hypothetical protein